MTTSIKPLRFSAPITQHSGAGDNCKMTRLHAQSILFIAQSMATEPDDSNDKTEPLASTRRAPGRTASCEALQATNAVSSAFPVPKGRALGVPVSASFAASPLPEGKEMPSVALNFVQHDDYHALLELARRGYQHALSAKKRCGFSLSLKPEGCACELTHTLKVRGANLLHFALCIGSFRAAAALIIVSPALLKGTCVVSNEREMVWTAKDLARLFCVLNDSANSTVPTSDISQTSVMFEHAVKVLELSETDSSKLPFVVLPTVEERIAAAGCDAEPALAAFLEAAQIKL